MPYPSQSLLTITPVVLSVGVGIDFAVSKIDTHYGAPATIFRAVWDFILMGGITYFISSLVLSPKGR